MSDGRFLPDCGVGSTATTASSFLRVADIAIELRYADLSFVSEFPGPTSRFEVLPCAAEVTIDIDVVRSLPTGGRLAFDSGSVWKLFDDGDGWRIDCHAEMFGAEPYKVARFDREFRNGRILLRS